MTELDTSFPRATPEQLRTLDTYLGDGWIAEPMSPGSDEIEIHDVGGPAWIMPNGNVIPL